MGIGNDTLVIIIVFSALGFLTILFVSVRLVRRSRVKSNPLPPLQPLAHHREQELAKYQDSLPRAQTWYIPGHLSPQTSSSSVLDSSASLLAKGSPSLSAVESQEYPAFDGLSPPNPLFHSRPGSSLSSGSSNDPSTPPSPSSRQPTPPLSETSSSPRPRMPSTYRQRPLSMSSSNSTLLSRTSKPNTLRGTPHSRYSQIQIVLPAPLALDQPGSSPSSLRRPRSRIDVGEGYDRQSVADKWVSVPSFSAQTHDTHPPLPTLPSTPVNLPHHRAVSAPSLSAEGLPNGMPIIPPVPQLPSMYKPVEFGPENGPDNPPLSTLVA